MNVQLQQAPVFLGEEHVQRLAVQTCLHEVPAMRLLQLKAMFILRSFGCLPLQTRRLANIETHFLVLQLDLATGK